MTPRPRYIGQEERSQSVGEYFAAFLIVFAPFYISWIFYWITGQPVRL